MKKLLHERLRVHRGGNDVFHCDNGKSVLALWPSEADAIADDIEKYYDPKPRDPEGNPVHKDMEVEGGVVSHWSVREDGSWTIFDNDYEEIQCGDKDEPIRLPEPKVLDTDGVEIKVGDTVYDTSNGKALKVTEVLKSSVGVIGELGCGSILAEHVTHREPDSYEKLRDDLERKYGSNSSWVKRLTAIMERDA